MRSWRSWSGLAWVIIAAFWTAGGAAEAASGDGPQLLHDFFPGEFLQDDSVRQPTRLGGAVFFIVQDLEAMPRVWRTDGTPEGTRPVVIPGVSVQDGDLQTLGGAVGRSMIWRSGEVLVSSGETGEGLVLPTRARPGPSAVVSGLFYFYGCDSAERCDVWSTDGTLSGTKPVAALADRFQGRKLEIVGGFSDRWLLLLGGRSFYAYDVRSVQLLLLLPDIASGAEWFSVGETLFFLTRHRVGNSSEETLWASRLDAPRARRVFKDPVISIAGQRDGRLYFSAANGRLFSTNGRTGGYKSYEGSRIEPYSFSGLADQLGAAGSKTILPLPGYYLGGLLATDEERSTVSVAKILCRYKYNCLGLDMSPLVPARGTFFQVIDGRLWQTDGTREGTNPTGVLFNVDVSTLRVSNDRLLLGATRVRGGEQLWETDGTAQGTRSLTDGTPDRPFRALGAPEPLGNGSVVVAERIPFGKQLFRVENGHTLPLTHVRHEGIGGGAVSAYLLGGRALWSGVSVPLHGGAVEELPLGLPSCEGAFRPCANRPVEVGGRLLWAVNGPEPGLASTDGTKSGSDVLPLVSPVSAPEWELLASGPLGEGALVLNQAGDLWTGDGTPAGTRWVTRIATPDPPYDVAVAGPPVALGAQTLFFRDVLRASGSPEADLEVWRTDGTAAGTRLLASIPFERSYPTIRLETFESGGRLFFRFRGRIWVSDGSVAGTHPLEGQPPGSVFGIAGGQSLFYAATLDADENETLWVVDLKTLIFKSLGRFQGLQLDVDDRLGSVLDEVLVFQKDDQAWVSDGTPSGTHPFPDARVRRRGHDFVTAGGRRYFTLCGRALGCELWTTDRLGTDIRLVSDLWPGRKGSNLYIVAVGDDSILFAASEPSVGYEVWRLDF